MKNIAAVSTRDKLKSVVSATHLTAFVVASLVLGACSKTPSEEPPTPMTKPVQDTTAPTTAGGADTSVPAAASVLTPATGTQPASAAGRSNSALSKAQESSAMPMPGQNNDHSAPVAPSKPASGP